MSHNPYSPPQSEVADIPANDSLNSATPILFPCSVLKLTVMSLCTLGLYQVFWFYKNWKNIKDQTGEDILPVARSIFGVFFCYDLFKRIRAHQNPSLRKPLAAGLLTTFWIACSLLYRLPDPLWLVGFLSIVPLLYVQAEVNAINQLDAPGHDPNARFSGWNWLAVVIGGMILVLMTIGLFVTQ